MPTYLDQYNLWVFWRKGGGELKNCKLLLNKKWVFKLNIILFGCFAPGCGWSFLNWNPMGLEHLGSNISKTIKHVIFFKYLSQIDPPHVGTKLG